MKQVFRFHIAREQIRVLEDMIERCNLERIIIVPWCSPTDVTFEIRLSQIRKIKDLLFQIFHECPVGFLTSYLQCFPDAFQEMHMTELDHDIGVDGSCRHANGFVVITDEGLEFVAGVLELCEELQQCLVILAGCQHADRNVMREIINAVDERDFLIVAFHCDKLSIDHKEAAEAFRIAVGERDLIVVWKSVQFSDNPVVSSIRSFADVCSDRADTRAFEMRQKNGLRFPSMIDGETFPAIVTKVSFQAIA